MIDEAKIILVAGAMFLLAAVSSWKNATPMTMVGRTDAGIAVPVQVDSNGILILAGP